MSNQLPNRDSIKELAEFWDSHDSTDFEDQLEEVTEPVFESRRPISATSSAVRVARNKHHTSWAGVLATAAELSQRCFDVTITLGNTPTTDLLAAGPDGSAFRVEVKSASTPNFVPIQKGLLESEPRSGLIFVIVLVPRNGEAPFRFFVMTHAEICTAWQGTRKVTKAGQPYKPGWEGLNWSSITQHENRWEKLPGAASRPAA